MGNAQCHFSLAQPHRALRVRATSQVRLLPRFPGLRAEASPAWDVLAAGLRYVGRAPLQPAVEYALPSPYVPRLKELKDYAASSFPAGRPVAAGALDLMHRIHADFSYESRSTDIDTPLAQAFAQRRGVCQDFAHLQIAMLRSLGIPARYVSGYLRTVPPEGQPRLVGADASHAWLSAYCGNGLWLDVDPTNNTVCSTDHITLAWGRDYGDVPPLTGVFIGGGKHRLVVNVDVLPLP